MKIAIVTAGGAGMFCGSCMHDNTWARGLIAAGHDVTLIPTYTPIRLDEENVSGQKVYLGGINIYMDSRSRIWRKIPRLFTRWLDHPWVIKMATKFNISNDAADLGELTIASIEGTDGPQAREVRELASFICDQLQPDVVCFSNILQIGAVHAIREKFRGKLFCVMQGDDIFLNDLPERYRTQACDMISDRADDFDGFLVHSESYRETMSELLKLPKEKFQILPLGIDFTGHDGQPGLRNEGPLTIGYFARICPEKGFHLSLQAFQKYLEWHPDASLVVGGYLGPRDQKYFDEHKAALGSAIQSVHFLGSPDTHEKKVDIFKRLDLFSVPTVYREPKGLPVLEAWANGVPVVQPDHGSFPEMIAKTSGGILVPPDDPESLAYAWEELTDNRARREELSHAGHRGVREHFSVERMIEKTIEVFSS